MQKHQLSDGKADKSGLLQPCEELRNKKPISQFYSPYGSHWMKRTTCRMVDRSCVIAHAARLRRATISRSSGARHSLLGMQRHYGNHYVQRVLAMRSKASAEYEVQPNVEEAIQGARGGGQQIDHGVRSQMESSFGTDFRGVRVHTDAKADALNQALNARAFTTGQDIFFRQGNYNPGSSKGRELLAHELTHVVQQNKDQIQPKLSVGQPGDRYEQEADAVAQAVMLQEKGVSPHEQHGTIVRKQPEEDEQEVLQMQPLDEEVGELKLKPEPAETSIKRQENSEEEEQNSRDLQELSAGVQAKSANQTGYQRVFSFQGIGALRKARCRLSGGSYDIRAKSRPRPKKLLSEDQEQNALVWYRNQQGYTAEIVKQIQEEVGSKRDGLLGPFTVQAVARWQRSKGLLVDGIAGPTTLKQMFGRDIRKVKKEAMAPEEEPVGIMGVIVDLLRSLGINEQQSGEILEGKEATTEPEPATPISGKKLEKRKYNLIKPKKFKEQLDGVSLKNSLREKMERMANHALDYDLVTGNIWFNSGMRSPKKAHKWSTAYQIRQGNVPLKKLQALPGGRDIDGNIWYQPGWTMKEIKENAVKAWSGALAAEGYPKGDKKREPNTFRGGVTRHATGKAIDAVFLWNWGKEEGAKKTVEKKVSKLKAAIEKRWAKRPQKRTKVLAAIEKFIGRGSYSEVAYKTVEDFGLKRPVLHATGSPEDWHYEEK